MAHPNQAKNSKTYRLRLKARRQAEKERVAELERENARLSQLLAEERVARSTLEGVLQTRLNGG
jgi:hypothetical protein